MPLVDTNRLLANTLRYITRAIMQQITINYLNIKLRLNVINFSYPENGYNLEYDPCVLAEVDFLCLWRPGCRWWAVRNQRQVQMTDK